MESTEKFTSQQIKQIRNAGTLGFKCFLKTHKGGPCAKNGRQRMGVYEVGNEEDQRKVHEAFAEKGLGKEQSMEREKWQLAVCRRH
jgi:hypothetical protein